jgi:hypothetical protein
VVFAVKREKVMIDGRVKYHLEAQTTTWVLSILNGTRQQYTVCLIFYRHQGNIFVRKY